jgi:hypothetical protein
MRQEAMQAFLTHKWSRELDYRLIKELWTFRENRIAVRFAYECHDDSGNWFRSYGNENWEYDEHGLTRLRIASINDLPIKESERKYHWPLGRRPDDHPGLTDLGLASVGPDKFPACEDSCSSWAGTGGAQATRSSSILMPTRLSRDAQKAGLDPAKLSALKKLLRWRGWQRHDAITE